RFSGATPLSTSQDGLGVHQVSIGKAEHGPVGVDEFRMGFISERSVEFPVSEFGHRIALGKLPDVVDLEGLSIRPEQRARIGVTTDVVKLFYKCRCHANTAPSIVYAKHRFSQRDH